MTVNQQMCNLPVNYGAPNLASLPRVAGRGEECFWASVWLVGNEAVNIVDAWTVNWWLWLLFGIVLLGLELLTPGAFFLMFFGAGAIVVGLLSIAGLAGPLWMQVLLFAALSLISVFSLRRLLLARLRFTAPEKSVDKLVGETAVALEDLAVDGLGKAELRGSAWSARNVGDNAVARGQRCTVVRVEGLTLWVRGA